MTLRTIGCSADAGAAEEGGGTGIGAWRSGFPVAAAMLAFNAAAFGASGIAGRDPAWLLRACNF